MQRNLNQNNQFETVGKFWTKSTTTQLLLFMNLKFKRDFLGLFLSFFSILFARFFSDCEHGSDNYFLMVLISTFLWFIMVRLFLFFWTKFLQRWLKEMKQDRKLYMNIILLIMSLTNDTDLRLTLLFSDSDWRMTERRLLTPFLSPYPLQLDGAPGPWGHEGQPRHLQEGCWIRLRNRQVQEVQVRRPQASLSHPLENRKRMLSERSFLQKTGTLLDDWRLQQENGMQVTYSGVIDAVNLRFCSWSNVLLFLMLSKSH